MRDKIVVTIEPPLPDDRLNIADAFEQVLDFLRLIELAAGEDADFDWKLDKASTNSPFTVVAYSPVSKAGLSGDTVASAQRRAEQGLKDLSSGAVPTWMRRKQRNAARRITKRFRSGIGRIAAKTEESAPQSYFFSSSDASKALATLEKVDGFEEIAIPKHRAYGEVEGTLVSVGTHYARPVMWIRTNSYEVVRCLFTPEKLEELGDAATIREIWEHKRVRVTGMLAFAEGGVLEQVSVDDMKLFPGAGITLQQVLDAEFTSGMEPAEYLDQLREGKIH